jgi:hypothetical protein
VKNKLAPLKGKIYALIRQRVKNPDKRGKVVQLVFTDQEYNQCLIGEVKQHFTKRGYRVHLTIDGNGLMTLQISWH